jgi:hypothetical protein
VSSKLNQGFKGREPRSEGLSEAVVPGSTTSSDGRESLFLADLQQKARNKPSGKLDESEEFREW